jgi:hypothetical protein
MSTGEATRADSLVFLPEPWATFFEQFDALGKAVQESLAFFYDPLALRKHWLEAWSQAMDGYLRSPAFLEAMRRSLEFTTALKAVQNQFIRDFARQTGVPLAADVHELSDRLERTEAILLERLKAIEDRLVSLQTTEAASQDFT